MIYFRERQEGQLYLFIQPVSAEYLLNARHCLGLEIQSEQDQSLALLKLMILEHSVHRKYIHTWGSVLISWDYCKKSPKTWWLYSLTVLEVKSSKSNCQQSYSFQNLRGRTSSMPLFQLSLVASDPQCPLAWPTPPVFAWPSLMGICVSDLLLHSLNDTSCQI